MNDDELMDLMNVNIMDDDDTQVADLWYRGADTFATLPLATLHQAVAAADPSAAPADPSAAPVAAVAAVAAVAVTEVVPALPFDRTRVAFFGGVLKTNPLQMVATLANQQWDFGDVTALALANAFSAYEGQNRTDRALEAIRLGGEQAVTELTTKMTALSEQVSQLQQAQRGASAQQLDPTNAWSSAVARFIRVVGWPSDAEPAFPAHRIDALRSIFAYQLVHMRGDVEPTPCLMVPVSALPLFRRLLKIVSPSSVDFTKLTQSMGVEESIRESSKNLGVHMYVTGTNPFPFENEKALNKDGEPWPKPRDYQCNVLVLPLHAEVFRALGRTVHDPALMQRAVSSFRHWLMNSSKFMFNEGDKVQWDGAKSLTPLLYLPPPVYATDLQEPTLRRIRLELGLPHDCHYSAGWVRMATAILTTPAKRRRRQTDEEAEAGSEEEDEDEEEDAPVAAARPSSGGKMPRKGPQALAAMAAAAAAARKPKKSKKVDPGGHTRQIPHHEREVDKDGEDDDDQPLSVQVHRNHQRRRHL